MTKKNVKFPAGWKNSRVVFASLSNTMTIKPKMAVAEYEAAMQAAEQTIMVAPTELVPEIVKLISKKMVRMRKRRQTMNSHGRK